MPLAGKGWYRVRAPKNGAGHLGAARVWCDLGQGYCAFHCFELWPDGQGWSAIMRLHRPAVGARTDYSDGEYLIPDESTPVPSFERISGLRLWANRLMELVPVLVVALLALFSRRRIALRYWKLRRSFSFPIKGRVHSEYAEWIYRNEVLGQANDGPTRPPLLVVLTDDSDEGRSRQIESVLGQLAQADRLALPTSFGSERSRQMLWYDGLDDLFRQVRQLNYPDDATLVLVRDGAILHKNALEHIRQTSTTAQDHVLQFGCSDHVILPGRRVDPIIRTGFAIGDPDFEDRIGPVSAFRLKMLAGLDSWTELAGKVSAVAAIPAILSHCQGNSVEHAFRAKSPHAVQRRAASLSVVIPTSDRCDLLGRAIDSVREADWNGECEIIVVDHESSEPASRDFLNLLSTQPSVTVISYKGKFNFAAMCNAAAAQAGGDYLLFLNNDVIFESPSGLVALADLLVDEKVGCAGALLAYPDRRIQHAGIILGIGGVAGNAGRGCKPHDPRLRHWLARPRTVSAVTGACLMVRRSLFDRLGGFDDANLWVAFNDVDLCLRAGLAGYRTMVTPYARLTHIESATREADDLGDGIGRFSREYSHMRQRWGRVLDNDPYHSSVFGLSEPGFNLRL